MCLSSDSHTVMKINIGGTKVPQQEKIEANKLNGKH